MAIEKNKINILLIDNDEDEYIITRDLFDEIAGNYNLVWFSNFDKGIEEIIKSNYDVCLLDFHLGEYNGIEFIDKALLSSCTTPIILLTGQGDHEVDLLAMKAGASDYLDKNKLDANILERAIRYTLERKKSEDKISFLAYYDQLTSLPNRTLFFDRLNIAFAAAKRHNRICAIMFLDIDNFKRINDSLGHRSGDILIVEVGKRLLKCIRREDTVINDRIDSVLDTVARLGGDEFTILLSEVKEPENASKVAERIHDSLLAPIVLENEQINITVSIGIAIYPFDGVDIESLIKNADIAMYSAKSEGKNRFRYYNKLVNSIASQRLSRENELRKAIFSNELELYYQAIIDLNTSKVKDVEALVRWNQPQKGLVMPMDFIPIAEEVGLIIDIGNFVLNSVGIFYNKHKDNLFKDIGISINISPKQLNQKNFVDTIINFLNKFNIPPNKLTFEITENCIINNLEQASKIINAIKSLGIKISLDDFGSGYSSFTILKQIAFDILKIDKSFIENISQNLEDSVITTSLIAIGHSKDLTVVAEGIETEEQLHFLKSNQCDVGQGYYFSRPISEAKLIKLIENW